MVLDLPVLAVALERVNAKKTRITKTIFARPLKYIHVWLQLRNIIGKRASIQVRELYLQRTKIFEQG